MTHHVGPRQREAAQPQPRVYLPQTTQRRQGPWNTPIQLVVCQCQCPAIKDTHGPQPQRPTSLTPCSTQPEVCWPMSQAQSQPDDQAVQDTDTYSSCVSADSHVGTVPVMAFVYTWRSLIYIHTQTTATQPACIHQSEYMASSMQPREKVHSKADRHVHKVCQNRQTGRQWPGETVLVEP